MATVQFKSEGPESSLVLLVLYCLNDHNIVRFSGSNLFQVRRRYGVGSMEVSPLPCYLLSESESLT